MPYLRENMENIKPKVLMVILPYLVKDIDANRPKIRSYLGLPYGVLSIVTYNRNLADFKVLDLNIFEEFPLEQLQTTIHEFEPDIVGISIMFDISYKYLSDCLGVVKNHNQKILTLLGGAAASYSYEEILKEQPDLDAICYSEGEIPLQELLGSGRERWFGNKAWITRGKVSYGIAPEICYVQNLDDVIDIDYSFVNPADYEMAEAFSPFVDYGQHKRFFLVTSRGCPFSCTFCNNHLIHGHKMRYASVDRIISHVKHLVDTYGMDVLIIYDDQLLFNLKKVKELFRRLAPFKFRIEMPNGVSVAFIDEELAVLMRQAGVDTLYLAIESGSPYVLKELIRKPLKLDMVKPAIEVLRKHDIYLHGFFVMGYPLETDEHRRETLEFCRDIDLDWYGFNMVTPVRGSELYDDCIKNDWIPKQRIIDIIDKKYIIHVPGTDPEQIENDVYQMNLDLNFHNNRKMRIGDYKTAAWCFEEVLRRYSGHEWAKHYLDICKERMGE